MDDRWFMGNGGEVSGLTIKLWAIFRGLPLIKGKARRNIVLEIDSTEVIYLLKDTNITRNLNRALLEDCHYLVQRLNILILHN